VVKACKIGYIFLSKNISAEFPPFISNEFVFFLFFLLCSEAALYVCSSRNLCDGCKTRTEYAPMDTIVYEVLESGNSLKLV